MASREIARRLVGGVWRTVVVDEAAGGSSQPVLLGPFHITFDGGYSDQNPGTVISGADIPADSLVLDTWMIQDDDWDVAADGTIFLVVSSDPTNASLAVTLNTADLFSNSDDPANSIHQEAPFVSGGTRKFAAKTSVAANLALKVSLGGVPAAGSAYLLAAYVPLSA